MHSLRFSSETVPPLSWTRAMPGRPYGLDPGRSGPEQLLGKALFSNWPGFFLQGSGSYRCSAGRGRARPIQSQEFPDIHSKLFFQLDQPLCNIFGGLICRFILVQILVQ